MSSKCLVKTKFGKSCQNKKSSGLETCWVHSDVCSICIEPIKKAEEHVASCAHRFHRHCIRTWRDKSCRCPMCREVVFRPNVVRVRMASELFEHPGICDFFQKRINNSEFLADLYKVEEGDEDFHVRDVHSNEIIGTIKKEPLRVPNAVPTR